MSKNVQRIRRLHGQYREIVQERQCREKEQTQKPSEEVVTRRVDALLYGVHILLLRAVETHYGVEDVIELPINQDVFLGDLDSLTTQVILHRFQEKCGLNLSYPADRDVVLVSLSSEVKCCKVTSLGSGNLELGFPAVLAENERRRKLWEKHLPETVRRVIDECKACLEAMPYKHYGIPETVLMWRWGFHRPMVPGCATLLSCLKVGDIEGSYTYLSQKQFAELADEMNKQISHGAVEIRICESTLYVTMRRMPKREVKNPYFDYKKFYSVYDEMTPQLQSALDSIVRGTKFPGIVKQISNLTPERKMVYEFGSSGEKEYEWMSQAFLVNDHRKCLIETLQRDIPGINVVSMRFLDNVESRLPHGVQGGYERIEFTVVIDETQEDHAEQVLKQLQAEYLIRYIKKRRVQYIANAVIGQVLDNFELYHSINEANFTKVHRFSSWGGDDGFAVRLDERMIHRLRLITDEDVSGLKIILPGNDKRFTERLREAVLRRSGGMLSIDVGESGGYYQFHFSQVS